MTPLFFQPRTPEGVRRLMPVTLPKLSGSHSHPALSLKGEGSGGAYTPLPLREGEGGGLKARAILTHEHLGQTPPGMVGGMG